MVYFIVKLKVLHYERSISCRRVHPRESKAHCWCDSFHRYVITKRLTYREREAERKEEERVRLQIEQRERAKILEDDASKNTNVMTKLQSKQSNVQYGK